ncbi:MAG: 6-phosphogluconolactonase [Acidimicrobiia bacterium]
MARTEPGEFRAGELVVRVFADDDALAAAAAADAANAIRGAVDARGKASVMFASGDSQLEFLETLAAIAGVPWESVTAFHLDEYLGIRRDHPASFRRYMREHVVGPLRPGTFHELEGDAPDAEAEARRYGELLRRHPLDLCCVGFGENGHLAFNDPETADLDDPVDVKVVDLDEMSRAQQVHEGHFATLEAVPSRAITATLPVIRRARRILAIVPELRKAVPVRDALEGPVTTACPASVLRTLAHATLYLDRESASLLAP